MRALQKTLEALARDRARGARARTCRSRIIAVDNASGEVLARVGSPDYFDERRAGQVDMTRAVRSPGSTLKPFIYGLAFEDGFVHPETLIDDRPIRFGTYAPENFDMTFQGTVPVRKALQLSLNVPAVALLDRVGASRLSSRLKQAGGTSGAAEGRGAGSRDGARRRRHHACSDLTHALCRARAAARQCRCALIERWRRDERRAAAAARSGRRLAGRQCAARHAAAGQRACAAASRSRPAPATAIATPGRSASTAASRSASGSGGPTARRCRAWSAAPPRRRSCSTRLRAPARSRRRCRRRRRAR